MSQYLLGYMDNLKNDRRKFMQTNKDRNALTTRIEDALGIRCECFILRLGLTWK